MKFHEKSKEDNIDFINLILMLNKNALIYLGESPRFVSGKKTKNLPLARQTIYMIKTLQEKCKNNLTPGETKLLFKILADLQKKYVTLSGLDKTNSTVQQDTKKNKMDKTLNNLSTEALSKLLSDLKKGSKESDK